MFDISINFISKLIFSKGYPSKVNMVFYYIFSVLMSILSALLLYLALFERGKFNSNIALSITCIVTALIVWPKIKFNWYIRVSAMYVAMRSLSSVGF
jgi:hypothetical protein